MLPEEVIVITETDVWEYWQRVSNCWCRFSIEILVIAITDTDFGRETSEFCHDVGYNPKGLNPEKSQSHLKCQNGPRCLQQSVSCCQGQGNKGHNEHRKLPQTTCSTISVATVNAIPKITWWNVKVLVFCGVCSFDVHAPYLLSADDFRGFSGIS